MDKENFKFTHRLKRTLNNSLYGSHFDFCFWYSRRRKIWNYESCRHSEIHKMWRCEVYLRNTAKCLWGEDCDVTSTNQPAKKLYETRAEIPKILSLTCLTHTRETTTFFFFKLKFLLKIFLTLSVFIKAYYRIKFGVAPITSVTDRSMALGRIKIHISVINLNTHKIEKKNILTFSDTWGFVVWYKI